MTKEFIYHLNSIIIVVVLLATILIVYETCFRIGRRYQRNADKEIKSQTATIQTGVLGLLALLLGFTFNMSLQRFDNRSNAVIKEAGAISTAILRARLLPAPYDSLMHTLLEAYVDLRIKISTIDVTRMEERKLIDKETDDLQNKLWETSIKAANIDPGPVTTGFFITSLNDVIGARGERDAMLRRHVPEMILFLLFLVFIVTGALMGYSSGLGLKRALIPTIMLIILIGIVVFIIIDLDRPIRGLIKVKQDSLMELKTK